MIKRYVDIYYNYHCSHLRYHINIGDSQGNTDHKNQYRNCSTKVTIHKQNPGFRKSIIKM